MIKLKTLIESYIRVEKSPTDLTVADGKAGRGIYFSLQRYGDMVRYYKQNSPTYRLNEIKELKIRMGNTYIPPQITQSNYRRYGRLIQDFIRKNAPNASGYVVNREAKGINLPKGK
jgi:hypothetical protein